MSSLLEQAIIDAQALRDAALKNAEQMVIEKYSEQIKTAVTTLLEQEDVPSAEDVLSPTPELGLGDSAEGADSSANPRTEKSDKAVLENVPVTSDTSADDVVELDLEELAERIEEIEEEQGMTPGPEVDRDELAEDLEDSIKDSVDADSLTTENLEADIEDLVEEAILEALKVDINPQKRGWMGASDAELQDAAEMELARQEDTEVKEELEALQKRVKELQESNESLAAKNKKIVTEAKTVIEENEKLIETVQSLKEKFDVVNTSNAKLLYINRTLDCGSLNERQKKKIVEAIAKAQDANEAKVIYETLQSTVESTEKSSGPKSLSEAVERRPTLLARPRGEKKTTSADIFADRMQRLAGIKRQ